MTTEQIEPSDALRAILATLKRENEEPFGAICDTIWHTDHETLFDFIESAIEAADAAGAQQAAPSGEAVAWLVLDKNGLLMHAAAWREAAHEHINDAINEHGLTEAAQWVVRPAYTHPAPAPAPAESVRTNAVQARKLDPLQDPMRPGYFMNYQQDETPAEMVLRKLACWLGVGGYNAPTVDAELFHRKIVDGIQTLVKDSTHPAPAPAAVPAGWMPIETAPRDGTVIDLWHSEFGRSAECYWGLPFHCCGEAGSYCDSDWHSLEEGWVTTFNEITFPATDYTHWMPLPPPPSQPPSAANEQKGVA